ncbi:MAG: (2Fe-2S)-binding protein [Bacillota bacterium]
MCSEIICRCEEVTDDEIQKAIRDGASSVNEVKRWTRAGMGLCQGRTCRRLIERMIALETKTELKDITPATYRQPVRPINMGAVASKMRTCKK